MSGTNINKVFYADSYHPIQAGSIDGTDVLPHDNAVYRALLCSSAGLCTHQHGLIQHPIPDNPSLSLFDCFLSVFCAQFFYFFFPPDDPFGDSKVIGDPYCTVFVGRLSRFTNEESLRKAMSRYGRVTNLRLVRHIVTGASQGYAFVEYETEREMRRAYEEAHHTFIDDSEIIVDYNRQQLMPGWIPRRLGGGLGGKKESGQLRFGGRERPFRAPLRLIPFEDLKRLGIPPPPEGRYLTRFEVPSPPRRKSGTDADDLPRRERKRTESRGDSPGYRRKSLEREETPQRSRKRPQESEGSPTKRRNSSGHRNSHFHTHQRHHSEHSHHHKRRSTSRDYSS